MTTLTNLTGVSVASSAAPAIATTPAAKPVSDNAAFQNMQAFKGFWRRIKHGQSKIIFESSAGGVVTINISDLWTLAESADPKLAIPVATPPAT
jgi:hypothetical protein